MLSILMFQVIPRIARRINKCANDQPLDFYKIQPFNWLLQLNLPRQFRSFAFSIPEFPNMIIRIVRLPVHPDKTGEFILLFNNVRESIRTYDGCRQLDLLRDTSRHNIIYTYSVWDSEEELDRYLHSGFFRNTWKTVRPLFDGMPEAWSLEKLQSVQPRPD